MTMAMLGSLLGGIGLFLLGMHLMTDGLKMSAGGALRNILDQGTKTAFRGILSGAAITAVVQSSSAVTVAIIGFVNAGLMTLRQSVGVIYGSNIGTTMTGWLVALVGFNVNIKVIALPAIGIGMALRIVFSGKRPGAAGLALAGFGIFFMGIGVLATAFQDLGQCIQLEALFIEGFGGLFLFVGIGFGLTRGRSPGHRRQSGDHLHRGPVGHRRHAERKKGGGRACGFQCHHRGPGPFDSALVPFRPRDVAKNSRTGG
ncbi:MAG: Na/Pi symporter [Deltaproteobacteria bacterium]|nr:Na/Pi symporter [Deltaproteobacteria bacterium]